MRFSQLKSLLVKFRENRCSEDEIRWLQAYFSDHRNESAIKEGLLNDLEKYVPERTESARTDPGILFERITSKIDFPGNPADITERSRTRVKPQLMRLLKVAAIVIPGFLLGGIFSYLLFNKPPDLEPVSYSYNEIKAPYGARSEIILPDGSSVLLNAGSSLRYMNVFNKENRDVYLEGEAYFKIARNKAIPFNVKAGDLNIEAIGTEFNVKSYEEEGIIETTLLEGKISISNKARKRSSDLVYLEPHQKAVYIKDENLLQVEDLKTANIIKPEAPAQKRGTIYIEQEIDPEPVIAWKDNMLILKGEELSNLAIKLKRKYDVQFIFESENIKNFRFTGTLGDETLTQVLDVIKLSAPIEYKLEGKTVRISENKQRMQEFSTHLKKKKS